MYLECLHSFLIILAWKQEEAYLFSRYSGVLSQVVVFAIKLQKNLLFTDIDGVTCSLFVVEKKTDASDVPWILTGYTVNGLVKEDYRVWWQKKGEFLATGMRWPGVLCLFYHAHVAWCIRLRLLPIRPGSLSLACIIQDHGLWTQVDYVVALLILLSGLAMPGWFVLTATVSLLEHTVGVKKCTSSFGVKSSNFQ